MSTETLSKLLLIDLPQELLDQVFEHLSRADVKLLSCVSQTFRKKVSYYIFQRIHGTWHQFHNLLSAQTKQDWFVHVRHIRISSADLKFEYQTNALDSVIDQYLFPHADSILVSTDSLSFWLKNHNCSHVHLLLLYLSIVTRGNEKLFHLAHLDNFASLHTLHLHNYNFRWGQDEIVPRIALKNLTLENCTWDYPFNLASFNEFDTLTSLSVIYSHDNTFVLLERYVDYLRNPFQGHLSSLRLVSLSFFQSRMYMGLLSPTVLFNFLECFSGLEELHLRGWSTNLDSLRRVLLPRIYEKPFKLRMEIDNLNEKELAMFLCLVQRHNLELRLSAT